MALTRKELVNLEGNIITKEEFENLYESEIIINFQNCGKSGLKKNCIWVVLTLIDGADINIYVTESSM